MSTIATSSPANTVPFLALLSPNAKLHAAIELDAQKTEFGEITYTVVLRGGVADLSTINTVIRKRYKY